MTLATSPGDTALVDTPLVDTGLPCGGTGAWVDVCSLTELDLDRGAAVLVDGHQVAVFRLAGTTPADPTAHDEVRAVGNHDPFCGANVIARGLVGSSGERVYVASPMYKHRFDLRTGRCLDDEAVGLPVWPARARDGRVEVLAGARRG